MGYGGRDIPDNDPCPSLMRSTYTIPVAIVLGGVIVAVAVYFSIARPFPKTSSGTGNPALVRPVGTSDHILGSPTAPVMIVEYSDFDCDYCKGFHAVLHQIIANEGAQGQVAWVFREFPLTEIHANAMKHAEAAECVAKVSGNDAFWKFADVLFANQPVDPSRYWEFAARAGVSGDAFATCFAEAATRVDMRITADRQNALDTGAIGTPYSLILVQGKVPIVIDQAFSYDDLKLLIDQTLGK